MQPSFRAFMSEIIDYAGLFPPAQLPLDDAIRDYARYRREPEAWMLGRFVCPAARLRELDAYRDLLAADPPFRFSVLGKGAVGIGEFLAGAESDLRDAAEFCARCGPAVRVDAYEVRIPGPIAAASDPGAISRLIDELDAVFRGRGLDGLARFFEIPLGDDWKESVAAAAVGLSQSNRANSGRNTRASAAESNPHAALGFKLRTGGVEPAAFPTAEQVAFVIEQCHAAGVPLKFTAGLHHPLRRFDPGVRATMHGFVNVFMAAVLAHASGFELHDIRAVVEEENPRNFEFTEEFAAWNDASASLDEIGYVRRNRAISFGSCSFDEPREDLRNLGLL